MYLENFPQCTYTEVELSGSAIHILGAVFSFFFFSVFCNYCIMPVVVRLFKMEHIPNGVKRLYR